MNITFKKVPLMTAEERAAFEKANPAKAAEIREKMKQIHDELAAEFGPDIANAFAPKED